MMKIRQYIYRLSCLTLLLSGCTPEPLLIDDIPVAESKMVVSTLFVPDVGVSFAITQNFSALNGGLADDEDLVNELLLEDLLVTLSSGDQVTLLDELAPGVYASSGIDLIEGNEYTLEVTDPLTLRKVSAKSVVKEYVSINELKIDLVDNSFDNDSIPHVTFSIQDPPEKNWYMMSIQKIQQEIDIADIVLSNQLYTHLLDDSDGNGTLLTDDFLALINEDFHYGDTLLVSLSNISESYYHFLEKRNESARTFGFVSEPFNFPSNVDGGYGFFNLHQPDLRVMILDSIP